MQYRDRALLLAAALSLALAGCDRGTDGVTGSGTADASGRSQPAQPGVGLQGGLGTSSMGAASSPSGSTGSAIPDGSRNRTTAGSVGNR